MEFVNVYVFLLFNRGILMAIQIWEQLVNSKPVKKTNKM